MDPLFKNTLHRTIAFLFVISLSTLLFMHLEYTEKDDAKEKYEMLRLLYESMSSKYNITIEEFNNFTNVAYEALSKPKLQWTYYHAADFVLQALTTIGYGYITPLTPSGQILCIFVSLLGIPITLLALKSIGELIFKLVYTTVTKLEKKILNSLEPKKIKTKSAVILFLLMLAFLLATARLHKSLSDWTFVEEVYFWFITFSTIGFGDYIHHKSHKRLTQLSINSPAIQENEEGILHSQKPSALKIFAAMGYMCHSIIGLCLVSSVLNSIVEALEEHKCRPRCLGCVSRKTQDHADVNVDVDGMEEPNTPQKRLAFATSSTMTDVEL